MGYNLWYLKELDMTGQLTCINPLNPIYIVVLRLSPMSDSLGSLLKAEEPPSFKFRRSGVELENLHFSLVPRRTCCCWSRRHIWRTAALHTPYKKGIIIITIFPILQRKQMES